MQATKKGALRPLLYLTSLLVLLVCNIDYLPNIAVKRLLCRLVLHRRYANVEGDLLAFIAAHV